MTWEQARAFSVGPRGMLTKTANNGAAPLADDSLRDVKVGVLKPWGAASRGKNLNAVAD